MVTLCFFAFPLLGQVEQTKLLQLWAAFGATCASAASVARICWRSSSFQPCLCIRKEELASSLALHSMELAALALGVPVATQLPIVSRAGEWLGEAVGECTLLLPSHLCPSVSQLKREFPLVRPVRLADLPQQSLALLLEIEMCLEKPSS